MNSILIVYGTTEGQTRKIAEFIANAVRAQGISVETVDSATDAATKVQPHFLRHNRAWLTGIPTAFASVSMTAVLNDAQSRAELEQVAKNFYGETGWTPRFTLHVAGALRYTQYDFFKRLVMRLIAKYHGGDTDTLLDHEYTDWNALTRFVQDFLAGAQVKKSG